MIQAVKILSLVRPLETAGEFDEVLETVLPTSGWYEGPLGMHVRSAKYSTESLRRFVVISEKDQTGLVVEASTDTASKSTSFYSVLGEGLVEKSLFTDDDCAKRIIQSDASTTSVELQVVDRLHFNILGGEAAVAESRWPWVHVDHVRIGDVGIENIENSSRSLVVVGSSLNPGTTLSSLVMGLAEYLRLGGFQDVMSVRDLMITDGKGHQSSEFYQVWRAA